MPEETDSESDSESKVFVYLSCCCLAEVNAKGSTADGNNVWQKVTSCKSVSYRCENTTRRK